MRKPSLIAAGLAVTASIPLLTAAPAWASETRTKNVSCGVGQRLNIVSNDYSYATHYFKGSIVKAWGTGGSHISDKAASGQSGQVKDEAGAIYSFGANCYCPSGTTCGS